MPDQKTEQVNLRMSPRLRQLLRLGADREHRTVSNFIEFLVLDYCDKNSVEAPASGASATKPKKPTKKKN